MQESEWEGFEMIWEEYGKENAIQEHVAKLVQQETEWQRQEEKDKFDAENEEEDQKEEDEGDEWKDQ